MAFRRNRKRKRDQTELDDDRDAQPSLKRIKAARPSLRVSRTEIGSRNPTASRPQNSRRSTTGNKSASVSPSKPTMSPYRTRSVSRRTAKMTPFRATNSNSTEAVTGEMDEDDDDDDDSDLDHQSPSPMSTRSESSERTEFAAQSIRSVRSQPSTPQRSRIKKPSATLSKSARRNSPNQRSSPRFASDPGQSPIAAAAVRFESDSECESPPKIKRKATPNWRESQESPLPPPRRSYHAIDVRDTPIRSKEGCTANRVPLPAAPKHSHSEIPFMSHPRPYSAEEAIHCVDGRNTTGFHRKRNKPPSDGKADDIWSIHYWTRKLQQSGDFRGKLVFGFIGFLAGAAVAYSGMTAHGMPQSAAQSANPLKTLGTDSFAPRTVQCTPCLEQCGSLSAQSKHCQRRLADAQRERDDLREEMAAKQCGPSPSALSECNEKCDALKQEVSRLARPGDDHRDGGSCSAMETTVDRLRHELGECSVEWGSCEQTARQYEALDAKRIQEIERQKERFSLCSEQLRRYKATAKQQKTNRR